MSGGMSDLDKYRTLEQWLSGSCGRSATGSEGLEVKDQQEARQRAEQSWRIQPQRAGMTAMPHCGRVGVCPLAAAVLVYGSSRRA
ncbi:MULTISPECIES: hypothetical protein [unclassified Streptomyces]|uniref:hypothetical protein n=1 Tax=unclassified Streptomyces TaxID=2593676 RepID=UPI00093FD891|nr:hypothetical protein [Streptomyces sp. TSRI0281]OKI44835.1 hypothetical protein A6A29_34500 [Streptomyces sp. TSRI0281]